MNWIITKALDYITGTEGQQRIRAGILALVLSIAAKWGLPPEIADYAANTIAGLGLALVASFTARKPSVTAPAPAPAPVVLGPAPENADEVPTIVE